MPVTLRPPSSVLLLAGREQFTPPSSFDGAACAATHDCVAIAVAGAQGGSATVSLVPAPEAVGLVRLGHFVIESEGLVSLRDIWTREHDAIGVPPGLVALTVWGDHPDEPGVLEVVARPVESQPGVHP